MWDENTGEVVDGDQAIGAQLASAPEVSMGMVRGPEDGSTLALMVRASQALVREPAKLIARAKQIGGLLGPAGFYRFPAGGSTVQGPSIDMAQALAQEWGGIVYQVRIVHAEPMASGGQRVHLRASVADMRSLVCAEVDQVINTAPPPGKFADKADQRERWNGMQVQSAASKIVRNAILRVLPAWYVDPAFEAATEVDGRRALNGKTLPEARKGASDALVSLGCKVDELEVYLGQPFDMWAVPQLSQLRELYADLKAGKQSIEAWHALVNEKQPGNGGAPKRTALGLPASNSSPITDDAAKNVAKADKGNAKAEQQELGK